MLDEGCKRGAATSSWSTPAKATPEGTRYVPPFAFWPRYRSQEIAFWPRYRSQEIAFWSISTCRKITLFRCATGTQSARTEVTRRDCDDACFKLESNFT